MRLLSIQLEDTGFRRIQQHERDQRRTFQFSDGRAVVVSRSSYRSPAPSECQAVERVVPTRRLCLHWLALGAATSSFAYQSQCCAQDYFIPSEASSVSTGLDTSITDVVYIDLGLCVDGARQDRKLGDKSILCNEPQSLGRLVIGLYGKLVPHTVSNFLTAVRQGAYQGTVVNKIAPGEFIKAGRQGVKRLGAVEAPQGLDSNPEVLQSKSFVLRHDRPGVVSLALAENDDEPSIRERRGYHNLEFLITTGPGPAPSLDGENLVFGRVLEGYSTLGAVAGVPTFRPEGRLVAFNQFAKFLGDERAQRAQQSWGRPIQPVVITGSGVLS